MTTLTSERPSALPALSRNTTVILAVLVLHGAVLWAMHSGLLRRVAEVVVPAEMLVEIMAPAPAPAAAQTTPQPKTTVKPQTSKPSTPAQVNPTPVVTSQPTPVPLAVAPSPSAPSPSAAAPTAVANASTNPNGSSTSPAAPAAPAAPPKLELPSSDADYLNNPKPSYPAASKSRREQGLVVVRVFIDAEGQASQASIKQSSGFERLDLTSLETALKWRYVPGKRAGVPQGMWFDVPFNWQITR
nr:TonB family protein [uncultured Rhodoferax sp.]